MRTRLVTALVAGTLALGACSEPSDPAPSASGTPTTTGAVAAPGSPAEAATRLANQLARCTLSGFTSTGVKTADAAAQVTEACKVLDGGPTVTVGEVVASGDTASADLTVTWSVPDGGDWTFDTMATFDRVESTWAIRWDPSLLVRGWQPGQKLALRHTQGERGDILGADGEVLVTKRPVLRVGLNKPNLPAAQWAKASRDLATLLKLDPASYAAKVKAYGPQAYVEAVTLRETDPLVEAVRSSDIPGIMLVGGEMSLPIVRGFAPETLGSVGEANAEEVAASKGALSPGDVVGRGGIQEQMEARLRGAPGVMLVARKPGATSGGAVLYEQKAADGEAVTTTLDAELQQLAESVVEPFDTKPAAIVVMRPSSGDVLAIANSPGSKGFDTARLGQYAPGSTFKIATSLALLRAKLTPASKIPCSPSLVVDGMPFRNTPGYDAEALGSITLRTAFAHSCNTAFISQRRVATQKGLAEAASALGLTGTPQLGVPAFLGKVPGDSAGTAHAASMIGQAQVQASPVGVATMTASVASGRTVIPRLVIEPEPESDAKPAGKPLTMDEAVLIQSLMKAVVEPGGSGEKLSTIPGDPILAKSGTAQAGPDGKRLDAWMTVIYGDLVVTVLVEGGGYGSQTALPVIASYLTQLPG